MSSTFEVPVISVKLEPHPNADTLSIVRIHGYQVVVKTEEYKDGMLAAYVPPDSVVPDRPEWAWLGAEPRHRRIRTRKFRGEWSHGLLYRPDEMGSAFTSRDLGRNVAKDLGISPYEPPSSGREGNSSRQGLPWYRKLANMFWSEVGLRPRGKFPYYDIENYRRYRDLFQLNETVIITEKVHGANGLYTFKKNWLGRPRFYMRSRTMWKWGHQHDWWQHAFQNTPGLGTFLKNNPDLTVYGEVYGRGIQPLDYGVTSPHFVAFDIWIPGEQRWMDQADAFLLLDDWNVPTVPVHYIGPFKGFEDTVRMVNEHWTTSWLAIRHGNDEQMSEGLVIQSRMTRKILKLVSDKFLEKGI